VPAAARAENDVNPPPLEPTSLVEAGLGPSRGDRARPELEHGSLRRRPARGQLQENPFAKCNAVEAADLGYDPNREWGSRWRADDDHLGAGRPTDLRDEKTAIELVQAEAAPPQSGSAEGDRREAQPHRRGQREGRSDRCDAGNDPGGA